MFYILYSFVLYICIINTIINYNFHQKNISFHINIYSCNRPYYYNRTLFSIQQYLKLYNEMIRFFIIWYDQGTLGRYSYIEIFNLNNAFFMNPIGYTYSFGLSFSYTPTMFVLLLEEDWVIDKNVYYKLKYKDFITFSINLFQKNDCISGILLRNFPYSQLAKKRIRVNTLYLDIYILEKPFNNFAYINGPSIYRTTILSLLPIYKDERSVGNWYYNRGYRLAIFNNSGLLKIGEGIDEHIFIHIGEKRTREGMCNLFMY